MPGSEAQIHGMFTCQWMKDFMTRADMRKTRLPNIGQDCGSARHGTIRMALFDLNHKI